MRTTEPRLGVVYEHPVWFAPLFEELDRRRVPFDRVDVSAHRFDLDIAGAPWTLALNRMSPSAHLRGHAAAIAHAREYLRYLGACGVDVVNGADAFALETSKVAQMLLLRRLALPFPRTRVVNDVRLAPDAARGLRFPVVVKPNIGGSGAGIQRYETPEALRRALDDGVLDLGIDRTALVQEFLPARGGHIVRVEVLGGRFLYAIKVYPNPDGFNLCPADICRPGEETAAAGDLCPADLPKVALRVEGYTPPAPVIGAVLAVARAARLDLAGVEYLVNDRDGEVYYYDINALSNFVADAQAVIGFNPYVALVDYLALRGGFKVPVPAGPSRRVKEAPGRGADT